MLGLLPFQFYHAAIHTSGSVSTIMTIPWRCYQKFWLCCVTTKKIPCAYWALQDLQQQCSG